MGVERSGEISGGDPFDSMPLRLMMLVEVRCEALRKYRALPEEKRLDAERAAAKAGGRREKERLIDMIERGEFS